MTSPMCCRWEDLVGRQVGRYLSRFIQVDGAFIFSKSSLNIQRFIDGLRLLDNNFLLEKVMETKSFQLCNYKNKMCSPNSSSFSKTSVSVPGKNFFPRLVGKTGISFLTVRKSFYYTTILKNGQITDHEPIILLVRFLNGL